MIANLGANALMLVVTVVLQQGALDQWRILRREKAVGALSFSLFRSIILKDLSILAFAISMPLNQAWSLLLLSGSSSIFAEAPYSGKWSDSAANRTARASKKLNPNAA